uniref:Sey1/RHD3-like three-helix bundle domain-containing protein n=1 Tax=Hanusia phi TaxID=3032 RepID=A0A7S0F0H7_9CRYP
MNNFKNEIISEISLTDKKKDDINVNSLSFELNKEKLTKIYQFSQSVIFIAFDTYRETLSKEFLNEMNIDKIYYNLLSTGYGILNNWSRIVNNGNYIKNFGSNVKEFIEKLNKEFNTQSKNFMWNEYALKKSDKLSDIIYKKIIKLFTKQLLMLQTQALDKFKDNLIESVGSNNDYDNEKFKLIQKIKDWFIINSSNLRIPELNFNINNALNELEQVLLDFAQKFNDSPIYKLLSLKKN